MVIEPIQRKADLEPIRETDLEPEKNPKSKNAK
jgi:hypothetical protein